MAPPRGPAVIVSPELEGLTDPSANDDTDALDEMRGDAAILGDPEIAGLTWQVFRIPRPGEPQMPGLRAGWGTYWCQLYGPLELEQIRTTLGGGTWRLVGRGKRPNGEKHREIHVIAVAGPDKPPPFPEPATTAPAAAPSPNGSTTVADKLDQVIALLSRPPAPAPAPPGPESYVAMFTQMAGVLSKFMPAREPAHVAGTPGPEAQEKVFDLALDMFRKGIEVGQTREGGEESLGETLVKLAPHIKDVLTSLRPVSPNPMVRAAAGAVRRPQTAEVPGVTREAATDRPSAEASTRLAVLVDALARAVQRETPADQLAYTAEDLLSETEYVWLQGQTPDALATQLAQHAESYPIFSPDHPQAAATRQYLEAFHRALTTESPDDDTDE